MSHFAPFVAYFKVLPVRNKRFEHIRNLQKLAIRLYEALNDNANLNLVLPGGGQSNQLFNFMNSDYANGSMIKPQFGESPAQLTLAGFFRVSTAIGVDGLNSQPHPDKQLIHAGEFVSGAGGAHPWRQSGKPTTLAETEVKELKLTIEGDLPAPELPSDEITIFRIDYKGITWGDRGHFFPQ